MAASKLSHPVSSLHSPRYVPPPIVLPPMVQLGYYPGGSGARYRPHLDRWANETNNRRELTFLVYVNVGWEERHGGI